ncbi:MAG: class I SAM-dependent methyltransferase [Geminicoccaceae bacterium]
MPPSSFMTSQYRKPHGLMGLFVGYAMGRRRRNLPQNQWLVDLLELEKSSRVLEIGCGPGLAVEACLARLPDGFVLGIDHSRMMARRARALNRKAIREGRAEIRHAGFETLKDEATRFDRILSVNSIQYLGNFERSFRAIHALLAPDGRVASAYRPRSGDPTRKDALRMAAHMEASMEASGFARIVHHEFAVGGVPMICVLGEKAEVRSAASEVA